jgi:hypothetical protein
MPNQGGGPISYVETNPCSGGSGNPQLTLTVPVTVLQSITEEQRRQIALIQTEFAQRVSSLLARSYSEISEVVRGESSKRE